eukprot:9484691-Pyramimonas_sp.AAC.2
MLIGSTIFGRWGAQSIQIVPELARERSRGLHRRIRRGTFLGLLHWWWGLLGISLPSAGARAVLRDVAALPEVRLEPTPPFTDLEV